MREELPVAPPVLRDMPEASTMIENCVKEYKPSRMECLKNYSINIRFLSIGCIIEVGCKQIPFTTVKEGMEALNNYVANPYENVKMWEKRLAKEEEL
jgi:hypothetical protein